MRGLFTPGGGEMSSVHPKMDELMRSIGFIYLITLSIAIKLPSVMDIATFYTVTIVT